MKKFLALILMSSVVMGLSVNSANASEEKTAPKIPYDQCNGEPSYMQEFPNLNTFKKYYPTLLAKGNSPKPPFYGKRYFNLACGGTALTGEVEISKTNQVKIQTCGDLAVQTEAEACSTEVKKYKDLMHKGKGTIFRDGKIFIFNKKTVTVTELYAPH